MQDHPHTIYKIVDAAEWHAAEEAGEFHGASIDLRDRFIHFSAPDQVKETAAKHFAGRPDLLLVAVDTKLLDDDLKWEASGDGDPFPHLYGVLSMESVRWTAELNLGKDGQHLFPADL